MITRLTPHLWNFIAGNIIYKCWIFHNHLWNPHLWKPPNYQNECSKPVLVDGGFLGTRGYSPSFPPPRLPLWPLSRSSPSPLPRQRRALRGRRPRPTPRWSAALGSCAWTELGRHPPGVHEATVDGRNPASVDSYPIINRDSTIQVVQDFFHPPYRVS